MVKGQPRRSFPRPSHFTRNGVAAVTTMLPLKAKKKRNPLMVGALLRVAGHDARERVVGDIDAGVANHHER